MRSMWKSFGFVATLTAGVGRGAAGPPPPPQPR